MSYNRQSSESLRPSANSSSSRYQSYSGRRDRDSTQRERANSRPPYGSSDIGVARERMRSSSTERAYRGGSHEPAQGGSRLEDSRARERRDYGSSGLGMPRYSGRHGTAGGEPPRPPPLSSRHTSAATLPTQSRGRSPHPPSFSRRSTEPGEVLEEGELEVDERSFSRSNAMGHRTFTMPTDRSKSVRQHGDPGVSRYRGSRPTSSLSVHPSQGAAAAHHILPSSIERKHSQSLSQPIISRQTPPPMQHTRDRTPSPKHEPSTPPPSETIRTPPPAPARPLSLEAGKAQNSDNLRVSQPQVPRQELHSRISDIDREIAECQERLVMMSGASQQARSATVIAGNSSSNSEQPGFLATNDRTVPSLSISPQKLTASGVDGTMPKSVRPAEPTTGSFVDNPNTGISSSTFVDSPTPVVPESGTASGKGDVVGRDRIVSASTWPMYKSTDSQTTASRDDDVAESGNDSDSEEEEGEEDGLMGEHLVKNNLKPLVSGIYRENQMRAAEMQAKLGAPFLESFPTFVPGSYPSPTDWPFWDENVKMHGKVRPHLEKILSRETIQNKSHARKLQEEYSELYSKWRKRVDKLDRQREAKQRNMVGGPPTSAGGGGGGSGSGSNSAGGGGGVGSGSGSTQSGTSFASTSSRRRHVSGSTIPTTDEFGFSLGPLFSASTNTALASEAAGRMDDYFLSDAVHSEAELQAIIERLQHDDARNPDIRSQRTAAVIPNMVTDPKERERLRFNNNCHLVADPITFYHARMPEPGTAEHRRIAYGNNGDTDRCWTQNEVSAFVAAYLTHPKQFGKIASYIPYKTMNDCVLFYYRNKKSLRLKDLEAKSNKRVRRSRQAAASGGGGGAGGRKRKERARERRERRAREEREKLAQEAAAGCAPVEYSGDVLSVAASADDGQMSNTRTSTFPSDDEGNTAAEDARGRTPEYSAEEIDVLERRSKGSALLRSIIAANRQRKSQAAMGCISLLGLRNGTISDDSAAPLLSPMNDDDDDVEDETPTSATAPATLSTTPSRRSRHPNGIVPPGKSRRKSPEPSSSGRYSAPGPLSPISPRALVSAPDTRSRQADDGEDEGAGVYARRAATDEVEEGEERGSLRTEASANSEEEGELVEEEDSRWEPQRRSRLYMELTAYAMGGSIVRTRRGRELEREKFGGDADDYRSGSSDDERRADHRKTSPADLSYDEEEEEEDEIVEASGIVGGRFQGPAKGTSSGRANSGLKQQLMRPRIVSRRSQSRFGATLTAVVDPNDSGRSASSVVVDQGSEADGSLYLMHRQPSNQRSVGQQLRSPSSVSGADRQRFENDGVLSLGDPPKESALDRYVVDGAASDLMRPISSYEALFMCSPEETSASGGAVVASPVRSTAGLLPDSNVSVVVSSVDPGSVSMLSFNAQRQQQQQQQQRFSSSPSPSGKTRLLSATVSALSSKKQLDAQIEEEAGTQSSVLVGAAAWLREDRKRVLRGFHKLGPDFAQVASLMPSKTMAQCRYFYYHYRTPGGVLLSDIIPNSLSLASAAHLSESKPGGIGSLVLPQTGMQPVTEPSSTAKTSYSGTPRLGAAKGRPATVCADTLMSQGVLKPPPVAAGGGKRQRTKSPASQMQSSSDDEEDETPLAAQLAETLAAQQQQAPPVVGVNTLAFQQRRASELIAQVRRPPELISPRVTPMASLAPPIKASGAGQGTTSSGAVAAGYGQQQLGGGVGGSSGIHGIGRTPSPHTTGLAQSTAGGSGAMTAKKSGYSSYWSVHERSAFMHYVVRIGADWPALAEAIGSKTGTQVRNYFRANREKLGLDSVVAEFEKNKAAGTVPPLTPFQPVSAVSVSSQSPASGMMSGSVIGGDEGVKKEKRGRKRKNERIGAESPGVLSVLASGASSAGMVSSDSIPLSQLNRSGSMAEAVISPGSAVSGKALAGNDASQPPSTPNTAPATMTNFPTIGIDGGRAVVYRRPLAPAGGGAGHVQHRQGQAFAAQPPSALGYGQPRMAGNGESGGGPMGRAESETVSSQATPPPVEGLPRLSSSPAPGYGMLHTSSLTSSGYRRTASAAYDPVHAAAESAAAEEKREVRVTKINALLNDESPTESHQSAMATDWFGTSVKEEEDATGMAALALAAMMGGGRTPTPTGQASGGGVATVAAPQQQAGLLYPQHHQQQQARHSLSVMQPPLQQHHHHYHARQSPMLGHRLPADPYAGGSNIIGAVSSVSGSAFSPIAARAHGSPMAISPPPPPHGMHQHYHHLQARPSSVGPVAATYHGQHSGGVHSAGGSPAIPSYSREMTPPQRMAVRQRKPSAPPLPPPGGGAAYVRASGRSSVSSSYAPYNVAQHQQQQMPGVVGRVAYASPSIQQQQMPPYSDGGRYGATGYVEQPSHGHYTQQQQQQQQQHSAPGGAPPYYYQQHPSPSANNPQPPPQYR